MCEKELKKISERQAAYHTATEQNATLVANQQQQDDIQKFWIMVNKAEANYGLGDMDTYKVAHGQARLLPHKDLMMKAFEEQIEKLRSVLLQKGGLLTPAWEEA